jgi:hypothetical protein
MEKLIGQGGRTVTSEYSELAAEDTERYEGMQSANGKQRCAVKLSNLLRLFLLACVRKWAAARGRLVAVDTRRRE